MSSNRIPAPAAAPSSASSAAARPCSTPTTLRRAEKIVADVRKRGDRALLDYARKLDGAEADRRPRLSRRCLGMHGRAAPARRLRRGPGEGHRSPSSASTRRRRAPAIAWREEGVELEERVTPLRRVGVYVPVAGRAYPSTVVMTVVPARVAGVREIAVATPPGSYRANPALRYTLARLGVTEIWGMGGAHAVAAFAYGTETIRRVDKIVGPGNAWVTAAKKLVFGDVAIDGIAGPSEVVIVADPRRRPRRRRRRPAGPGRARPAGRRGARSRPTPSSPSGWRRRSKASSTDCRPRRRRGRRSPPSAPRWSSRPGRGRSTGRADRARAPAARRARPPRRWPARSPTPAPSSSAPSTPEVFGDYIAGPSHVLPTCGSARFASALGVEDFLRRSHRLRFSRTAASHRAAAAATLADAEGLPAHAAAARRRLG